MKKITFFYLLTSFIIISCSKNSDVIQNKIELTGVTPITGYIGDEITINFSNINNTKIDSVKVLFNGIQSHIKDTLANELICIVPKYTTTGKIELRVNKEVYSSDNDFILKEKQYKNLVFFSGDRYSYRKILAYEYNNNEDLFEIKEVKHATLLNDADKLIYNKKFNQLIAFSYSGSGSYYGVNFNTQQWTQSHNQHNKSIITSFTNTNKQNTYKIILEFIYNNNGSFVRKEYYLSELNENGVEISKKIIPNFIINNQDEFLSNSFVFIKPINKLIYFSWETQNNSSTTHRVYFLDTENLSTTSKVINNPNDLQYFHDNNPQYDGNKNRILFIKNHIQTTKNIDIFEYNLAENKLKKHTTNGDEISSGTDGTKAFSTIHDLTNELFIKTERQLHLINLDNYNTRKVKSEATPYLTQFSFHTPMIIIE